jgi:single-stranded DNA-binding protein
MKTAFARELKAMIEGEIQKQKVENKQNDKRDKYERKMSIIENENKVINEASKDQKPHNRD